MYQLDQSFLLYPEITKYNLQDELLTPLRFADNLQGIWLLGQELQSKTTDELLAIFETDELARIQLFAPRGYSIACLIGAYDELISIHTQAVLEALALVIAYIKDKQPLIDKFTLPVICNRQDSYNNVPWLSMSCILPRNIVDDMLFDSDFIFSVARAFNKYMYEVLFAKGYKLRKLPDCRFELEEFNEFALMQLHNDMARPLGVTC